MNALKFKAGSFFGVLSAEGVDRNFSIARIDV